MGLFHYLFEFVLLYLLAFTSNSSEYFSTLSISVPPKISDVKIGLNTSHSYEIVLFNDQPFDEIDSITIPLKRAGKLIMVEAKIDGQIGNLIFDTGASGLVLNKTYFRNSNLLESVSPRSITGAVEKIYRTTIDSLEISGILYMNKKADVVELGHIENRRGIKVLGLFGFELLRNFEIVIDIHNSQLKLIKVDKNGNKVIGLIPDFRSDYTMDIRETNNILFLSGIVGGKTLKFCFDTGAEINAISNSLQKVVLNTISITRRSKLVGANSLSYEVFYGTMNDFSFGDKQLDSMQTVITNITSLEEAYDVQFDGVLGYEFLNKGILCINLKKKQLGIHFMSVD